MEHGREALDESATCVGPPNGDPDALVHELEPEGARRAKAERSRWLHTVEMPALRAIGFALVLLLVAIHDRYLVPTLGFHGWLRLAAGVTSYTALAAWLMRAAERRGWAEKVSFALLHVDLIVCALVIYLTGAERSWLFVLPLARVADQAVTQVGRVVWFAHMAALAYLCALFVSWWQTGAVDWSEAFAKLSILYVVGIYVALTTRMVGQLQQRTADALRLASKLLQREREAVRELERARREAEEAAAGKGRFLAHMSHELRTPLNAVIGMTGLLLEGELGPRERQFAETIRSSGRMLLHVINDVLDFSKIEAGRLELERLPFDLARAVTEAIELLYGRAREKGLEIRVEIEPTVPRGVIGDRGRLQQVLLNLLSNAVKFTERGHVALRVSVVEDLAASDEAEGGESIRLVFEVRDTGIGVDPALASELFSPFAQADTSTTRRFGGTGLGLTIARELVELMGGTIELDSEVGQGATFRFTVMLERAPEHAVVDVGAGAEQAGALGGKRVLVVEDDALGRELLAELLEQYGLQVETTEDGVEAYERVETESERFDAVVADLHMPGLRGDALARKLLELGPKRPVMVILSGSCVSDPGVLENAGERAANGLPLGVDAWLTKPLNLDVLLETLERCLLERAGGDRRAAMQLRLPDGRTPYVLVVEDNAVNQQIAGHMLEKLGCRFDVVANGREALQACARRQYDAVLMDCQMPEMDGFEATRRLRERERERAWAGERSRLPVIALTAFALLGDRERCLEAGMDAFIAKPVTIEMLRKTLASVFAERALEPSGGRESSGS